MKIFIFGATGDLVKRKILPALHNFENLEIYVLGRRKLENYEYNKKYCEKCSENFKINLNYVQINFEENLLNQIENLLDKSEVNYFYISLPPSLSISIIKKINPIKDAKFKIRILLEKPFGSNLNEALKIKNLIEKYKIKEEIFLADHYLFKKDILNLKEFSFKKLKIVVLEKIGIEGREYYDSVGAMKDMVQSHFLNILNKLMDFSEKNVKINAIILGQYKDYQIELNKKSKTETYLKINLQIKDKEIEFETGKNFPNKESFIEIDNAKISLESCSEDYVSLFRDFFKDKKKNFPTIESSIKNWEITEKIEKNKPELILY